MLILYYFFSTSLSLEIALFRCLGHYSIPEPLYDRSFERFSTLFLMKTIKSKLPDLTIHWAKGHDK